MIDRTMTGYTGRGNTQNRTLLRGWERPVRLQPKNFTDSGTPRLSSTARFRPGPTPGTGGRR